jgi:RNA polymerase sigma-70 factor (ECF subfamily)
MQLSSRASVSQTPERTSPAEERRLVLSAQAGDPAALRALLSHFAGPLRGAVILPRVGSAAEADEILAEVLEKAALKLDDFRYEGEQGIWPWLKRIAVNAIIDRARRRKTKEDAEERYGVVLAMGPRVAPGAEAELIEREERRERQRRLEAGLRSLSERYRRAIELRILEEKSREECAALLEVTVGTFDVLLHRAVTALKKHFPEGV